MPRFLPVQQDFAVVVGDDIPAAEVEAAFRTAADHFLPISPCSTNFVGLKLAKARSAWPTLTFTAPDRTLTDRDLVKIRPRIEKVLRQRVEGALRVRCDSRPDGSLTTSGTP